MGSSRPQKKGSFFKKTKKEEKKIRDRRKKKEGRERAMGYEVGVCRWLGSNREGRLKGFGRSKSVTRKLRGKTPVNTSGWAI